MKRGSIITLTGNNNFGNRLQNYALQKYLEQFAVKCDTLWVEDKPKFIVIIKEFIKSTIILILSPFSKKFKKKLIQRKRSNKIRKFTNKYIKNRSIPRKKLDKIENDYDIFIFGSDQVWHPYAIEHNELVCGNYIKHTKKISYAASLAVDKLDGNIKQKLRNSLLSFNKITVREEKGKEILEEIIPEKQVDVVIDPTMLLAVSEWNKISKKPKKLKDEKYIVTYFLGRLSSERREEIERIARENNCKVINILDKKSELYVIDPREFVYLEKNAFLICTDSFHSCVFAILFNRPFLVFDREDNNESMSSRMDTLLKTFKLEDRKFKGIITKDMLKFDYTQTNKILEKEKVRMKKTIKECIEN